MNLVSRWMVFTIALFLLVAQLQLATNDVVLAIAKDRTAPTIPTKLVVKTRDANSVSISWATSRDNVKVAGYHVYRNGMRIVATHKSTNYMDRNLSANRTYQYTIRAIDTAGNVSRLSSVLTAKTLPQSAPIQESFDPRFGVYYEIFVRAFADSNNDGIGDFNGITQKLDYLNDGNPNTTTDLGIDAIWLMPIFESPSYHGYDITNYYNVNWQYGSLNDFKRLVKEAHKRGIEIILDMVLNHTSKQHQWFREASNNPSSKYRNWYVWSNNQTNISEKSAVEGKAWHGSNYGHYLGAFWSEMPDLNFDNPEVRKEAANICKYWLELGVDGFRMDAAKHIYDDLESSKYLEETVDKNIAMWQEFRKSMNLVNPKMYMIGEVWDTTDAIAPFLNQAYDSAFNFDLAEKIVSAADTGVAEDIAKRLQTMYTTYKKASGGKFIDAPFLANHDQERVMSTFNQNVDKAKLAAAMLLTLPGTPYLYYGEEVGMIGKKPDEKIRLPFPWYASGWGTGQTNWSYDGYYSNENKKNALDVQKNDANSLFHHYRKLIHLRKKEIALHQGEIKPYPVKDYAIEAYYRASKSEKVGVFHNLSDAPVTITLSTSASLPKFNKLIFETNKGTKWSGNKLTIPAYTTLLFK